MNKPTLHARPSPPPLIILITTGMKPLTYNFQKIKGHLDLSSIKQNNITQNKSSFNELLKMG